MFTYLLMVSMDVKHHVYLLMVSMDVEHHVYLLTYTLDPHLTAEKPHSFTVKVTPFLFFRRMQPVCQLLLAVTCAIVATPVLSVPLGGRSPLRLELEPYGAPQHRLRRQAFPGSGMVGAMCCCVDSNDKDVVCVCVCVCVCERLGEGIK